jgi:hypothetical protein
MPGAVARNFHSANRSEILADYLLSGWGTVTPVRRQDDYGVDLYCTLTAPVGQRSVVTDYYSVQVKSNDDPWHFKTADEIRWLFEYPTPLFLACVDRTKTVLSIYQTMSRFLAGFWDAPAQLELTPSTQDLGKNAEWVNGERFSLSAPILRVSLGDFSDEAKLATLRDVFQSWVEMDSFNCDLRRIGILRFRMPYEYRVNEVPDRIGFAEQGRWRPTEPQLARAVKTLLEVVDCVGDQLRGHGDRSGALYAALLLRYLRTSRAAELANDPRWKLDVSSSLETNISYALNEGLRTGVPAAYVFEGIDELFRVFGELQVVSKYLSKPAQ